MKRLIWIGLMTALVACGPREPSVCDGQADRSPICSQCIDAGIRYEDVAADLRAVNDAAIAHGLYTHADALAAAHDMDNLLAGPSRGHSYANLRQMALYSCRPMIRAVKNQSLHSVLTASLSAYRGVIGAARLALGPLGRSTEPITAFDRDLLRCTLAAEMEHLYETD